LKLNEWWIRRNEVSVHLEESSRSCLPLFLFLPFLLSRQWSSRIVTPCGMFPRRTSVFEVFVVDYDTYALALEELSCALTGLSRLGQYRKRLTCTLTRIQETTCSLLTLRLFIGIKIQSYQFIRSCISMKEDPFILGTFLAIRIKQVMFRTEKNSKLLRQ